MKLQWVQYNGKPLRPKDQSWASFVTPPPGSPSYAPLRTRRWPEPHGFIVKVTFSSSSVIVKLPGLGPTPEHEWARQVAASSSTSSRRSRASIASWWRRQPRSMFSVQASATPSSPSRCWMKEMRSSTPPAIRSWSICHSCFISPHRRRASSRSPASMASIARSIVGRESCASCSSENQRSVIVPSFDDERDPIVTPPRRALVTGAARGIGAAIAERLARDGLEVLTLDLRDGCDLTLDVAHDPFPPLPDIDVCVANAGVTTTIAPAHRMTAEQWQLDIDVNLTGAFRTVQACLGGMRERGHGRIVVISSVAALGGLPGQVAYAASKSGQLGMVQTMASENAAHGITVNAILPGLVATEQVLGMPEEVLQRALQSVPDRRLIEPSEIASAVAFLAGQEAARISGQAIAVDGGASLTQLSLGRERR